MSQGKGRPFIKRPADQRRPAWHSTAPLHYTTVVSNGKKFAENNLTFVSCFDSCSDVRKFVLVIEKNPRLKAEELKKKIDHFCLSSARSVQFLKQDIF